MAFETVERITIQAFRCEGCNQVFSLDEVEEVGPLFECSSCGMEFTREGSADGCGHRCPECNKFGSKTADFACPECQDCAVDECEVVQCAGCEAILDDDDSCEEQVTVPPPEVGMTLALGDASQKQVVALACEFGLSLETALDCLLDVAASTIRERGTKAFSPTSLLHRTLDLNERKRSK